jgi:hypothetical protein
VFGFCLCTHLHSHAHRWGQGEEAVNEFMDQWCTGFSIKEHIEQPIVGEMHQHERGPSS